MTEAVTLHLTTSAITAEAGLGLWHAAWGVPKTQNTWCSETPGIRRAHKPFLRAAIKYQPIEAGLTGIELRSGFLHSILSILPTPQSSGLPFCPSAQPPSSLARLTSEFRAKAMRWSPLGPRPPANQSFTARSPAPVQRMAELITRWGDPSSLRSAMANARTRAD